MNETHVQRTFASPGLDDPAVMEYAIFCIENLARRHGKTADSVYATIAKPDGLLDAYLVPSYDFLHTQDKEYILDDLDRALATKGVGLPAVCGERTAVNADPTLLQMKFARIVTKFTATARIPARDALDFFYRSRFYPLLRDGVADLHCMSDEYLVDDLLREYAERAPYAVEPIPPSLVAEPPAHPNL